MSFTKPSKSQSGGQKAEQLSLLQSNASFMHEIISLPKIDLHRHVTGSLTAQATARIAAKHNIELPTYISSDLDRLLFSKERVSTHTEYFSPWPTLNKLFQSIDAVEDIIFSVAAAGSEDNVAYMEVRVGPRGFLGSDGYSFKEYAERIAVSIRKAEEEYGIFLRCIVGIPRHVFIKVPQATRERMLESIIYTIRPLSDCFVGIDLNGDELSASVKEFDALFKSAHRAGMRVTVHAGEVGDNPDEVDYAVKELHASRIGHGIAAASSSATMALLSKHGCTLEICPTSNQFLGLVKDIKHLPLNEFSRAGVPFVICTDNPARCQTTLSEEFYKVAKAFNYSIDDLRRMVERSLSASFASDDLKTKIAGLISTKSNF